MPFISLKDANDMIDLGVNIRDSYNTGLRQLCAQKGQLAINYTSSDFNAFIFSKDEILRFFKDDLVNPNGEKIKAATHLIVVVGAQIKDGVDADRQPFKEGELTVISAGVNKIADNNYVCLDLIEPPGNEHTPRIAISELQQAPVGGGNNILNFKIKQ